MIHGCWRGGLLGEPATRGKKANEVVGEVEPNRASDEHASKLLHMIQTSRCLVKQSSGTTFIVWGGIKECSGCGRKFTLLQE